MSDNNERPEDPNPGPDYWRLSQSEIYRMVASGEFPKPVCMGRRTVWREKDLQNWLDSRG